MSINQLDGIAAVTQTPLGMMSEMRSHDGSFMLLKTYSRYQTQISDENGKKRRNDHVEYLENEKQQNQLEEKKSLLTIGAQATTLCLSFVECTVVKRANSQARAKVRTKNLPKTSNRKRQKT
jgi:hypothetical protein